MAASSTPPNRDRPLRSAIVAGVALLAIAGTVLYLLVGRTPVGVGAPPPHAVPRGTPVSARTPLDVGDQVEALSNGRWCDAVVLETFDDGRVRVHYIGWPESYDEELTRDRLAFDAEPPGGDVEEERVEDEDSGVTE